MGPACSQAFQCFPKVFCELGSGLLVGFLSHQAVHLFVAVKMSTSIYKFYGSYLRSHLHTAIFICTKQFVLLLDIENWCVLPYLFNVLP